MSNGPNRSEIGAVTAAVSEVLEPTFGRIEQIAASVVASHPIRGGRWQEGDLGRVQRMVLELIAEDDMLVGMGFVAAPGAVSDRERFMLWWQRDDGRTSRLKLNFDRSSIDVYDYVEMDWYRLPAQGRVRMTMGPYIDYSGSELYIVTATVPVVVGDRFVGVAGADLLFADLEARLVNAMRATTNEAVIVNSERRVVAANSPRWAPGVRLPAPPTPGGDLTGVPCQTVDPVPATPDWLLATIEYRP